MVNHVMLVPWNQLKIIESKQILKISNKVFDNVYNLCKENRKKTDVTSLKILISEDLHSDLITEHITKEIE